MLSLETCWTSIHLAGLVLVEHQVILYQLLLLDLPFGMGVSWPSSGCQPPPRRGVRIGVRSQVERPPSEPELRRRCSAPFATFFRRVPRVRGPVARGVGETGCIALYDEPADGDFAAAATSAQARSVACSGTLEAEQHSLVLVDRIEALETPCRCFTPEVL